MHVEGSLRTDGFPRVFGQYLLLSSLGRGGMGEVFLAKRHAVGDVDRLCIVKTLRADLSEHQEYVRRFLDEARVVVQLNHAHICQVFETTRVGAEHCLAMEYIAGVNVKDLAADLAQSGARLEPGLALYLVSCVLDALAYAHRFKSPTTGTHLRVIHRDVSPANVMVSFDGDVKLIDFGLAESSLKTEQTETRLVMGKVGYMAPEQARGDEVDGSVDQFAAGVMLYELLTGDRFYGAMNTHQIWQVVGRGGHVPARWLDVPDALRNAVARALDASPALRFDSCDQMRDALDELRARLFPRTNKGQLRELMARLYGDRAAAEQDLIASFADLRAPSGEAPRAPVPEMSTSSRVPAVEDTLKNAGPPGTEPWRNSPSSSDIPVASMAAGVRVDRPEVTLTSPASRSHALTPPAAAPERRRAASPARLAASALGVVAVVGATWIGLARDPPQKEPTRVFVADAGAPPQHVTEPHAPPGPSPHVDVAAPPGVDAGEAVGVAPRDDTRPPRRVFPLRDRFRPDRLPAPRDTSAPDAPPPPPITPPATSPTAEPATDARDALPVRTLAEDMAIVRTCRRPCASAVIQHVDAVSGKLEAKATLIRHCAESCLKNQ